MKKLYLDTTIAKEAKVEISENGKQIQTTTETSPVVAIEKSLEKAKLKLKDIDSFEANAGPGSYTGIRVGLAVINTLNWVFGKKAEPKDPKYQ